LFFSFEPKDTDGDGIYEIEGKQYTSLIGRADYVGTASCILKYNTQSKVFEVIDAWYEPDDDINTPPKPSNTET